MKTSFLVGLLAVCLACGSGKTVLKGHIENYNGETVSIVPMDDYDSRDTLKVDASGNFAYTPANEASQEYVLSVHGFAPYNNCIYLGTGDQVEVNFVLSPSLSGAFVKANVRSSSICLYASSAVLCLGK